MQRIQNILESSRKYADNNTYIDPRSRESFNNIPFTKTFPSEPFAESYTNSFRDVNYSVVYTHTVAPWTDKSDKYISPQSLVYCERKTGMISNDLTVASLNYQLRIGYEEFMVLHNNGNNEIVNFKRQVADNEYNLMKIEAYDILKNIMPNVIGFNDIIPHYNKMKEYKYRFMTKFGILSSYNFLGVALTRGDSTDTPDPLSRSSEVDTVSNVTSIYGGRATVSNIWGGPSELMIGTQLYLILIRNEHGMFQIRPYATRHSRLPTQDHNCHAWYVGQVNRVPIETPSQRIIEAALTSPDPIKAYQAVEALPPVNIDVRI